MKQPLMVLLIAGGFSLSALAQTGIAEGEGEQGEGVGLTMEQFEAFDRTGDGYIEREDAEGEPMLSEQFNDIDKDGDGRISQAEFAAFLAETQQDPEAEQYLEQQAPGEGAPEGGEPGVE
ncbi:EF-hand domain-containing protein [Ectothiorhodospiraceae bacterium 2226]|nr:EF-hand domain-containing protein [Ectothiorhodospiraceae bacterium 2226]